MLESKAVNGPPDQSHHRRAGVEFDQARRTRSYEQREAGSISTQSSVSSRGRMLKDEDTSLGR